MPHLRLVKTEIRIPKRRHEIRSDGISVWVNNETGLIGRFGMQGIDVHVAAEQHFTGGHCLHCTQGPVTAEDWETFKAKMLEHHQVKVSDRYKPKRFR